MDSASKFILSAEEAFARRVALGVIVARPVKVWLQMIPGMFLFDYLKRGIETRRYTRYFMPPRILAMEKALAEVRGDPSPGDPDSLEEKTRALLEGLGLYSPLNQKALIDLVLLLAEHYAKLIKASGENTHELIRAVYGNRKGYEDFLAALTLKEEALEKAMALNSETIPGLSLNINEKRKSAKEQREKDLETLF